MLLQKRGKYVIPCLDFDEKSQNTLDHIWTLCKIGTLLTDRLVTLICDRFSIVHFYFYSLLKMPSSGQGCDQMTSCRILSQTE